MSGRGRSGRTEQRGGRGGERGGGRGRGRGGGRGGGERGGGRGRGRGGGRGGGGGRQPDKDQRNVGKEIQVSVNAFALLQQAPSPTTTTTATTTTTETTTSIDTSGFITAELNNPLVSEKRRKDILADILQPHQYMMQKDGSVFIDPSVSNDRLNRIWETQVYQRASAVTKPDDKETSAAGTDDKIALVDALHRAWDLQGDGYDRSGGFVYSTAHNRADVITPGVAIRTGHVQSIRQQQTDESTHKQQQESYMIVKPVAAPVTVRETLLNFLQGMDLLKSNKTVPNARAVGDAIRGLWVESHHKTYKIYMRLDGIQSGRDPGQVGARNTFFEKDDGRRLSVADHFRETHNITLQYPDLPLVYRRVGRSGHFVYVPMEVLSLTPGKVRQSIQSDEILKRSKMSASEFMALCQQKAEKTDKFVKHLKRAGDLILSRASFTGVSSRHLKATALVLPTPKISVKDSSSKNRNDVQFVPEGNWNWRDRAALIPPSSPSGLKIGFVDGSNDARAMDNCVDPICKEMKIHTGKTVHAVRLGKAPLTSKKALDKLIKANISKMDCLVALLPERVDNTAAYRAVKSVCDANQLPSQCIKKWFRELNAQHARNLVLKMNGKIGGINHAVRNLVALQKYMPMQDKTSNTLFIGIDVYHGGLEVAMNDPQQSVSSGKSQSESASTSSSGKRPDSTLAMVGMFGPDLRHTTIALENVPGGTEIMPHGFSAVIERCLDGWRKKTGSQTPGTVIVYRDGIGISSYENWYESEIEKGFRAVLPKDSTNLVLILSTKRHDVRFSVERDGKQTNLDSGTVIHKVPFLENKKSFYLQSYKALSAGLTAKATHYQVFENDCGWSMRFIYDLTYALTHMQQRASGAVAIPAPVAAADMAAYRARPHTKAPDVLKLLEGTKLNQWFL